MNKKKKITLLIAIIYMRNSHQLIFYDCDRPTFKFLFSCCLNHAPSQTHAHTQIHTEAPRVFLRSYKSINGYQRAEVGQFCGHWWKTHTQSAPLSHIHYHRVINEILATAFQHESKHLLWLTTVCHSAYYHSRCLMWIW